MILCCGEALIDMVPPRGADTSPYGSFEVRPGGSVYNSAIAAARLGAPTAFLGRIASDFLGETLFRRLVDNGVDTGLVVRSPQPVTLAFVHRNDSGEADYAFYANDAADRSLSPGDIPESLPPDTHFLLVGSISLVLEPGASAIERMMHRESGRILVSYDPNVRPSLVPDRAAFVRRFETLCAQAAIVKASTADLEWIYGPESPEDFASKLLAFGPDLVVLTMGTEGSAAATHAAAAAVPAFPVKVADTIGAGDTFHAAILAALESRAAVTRSALRSLDSGALGGILSFASAAAALNCTRKGAEPPSLDELANAYPILGIARRS